MAKPISIREGGYIKWRENDSVPWSVAVVKSVDDAEIVTNSIATLGPDRFTISIEKFRQLESTGSAGKASREDLRDYLAWFEKHEAECGAAQLAELKRAIEHAEKQDRETRTRITNVRQALGL